MDGAGPVCSRRVPSEACVCQVQVLGEKQTRRLLTLRKPIAVGEKREEEGGVGIVMTKTREEGGGEKTGISLQCVYKGTNSVSALHTIHTSRGERLLVQVSDLTDGLILHQVYLFLGGGQLGPSDWSSPRVPSPGWFLASPWGLSVGGAPSRCPRTARYPGPSGGQSHSPGQPGSGPSLVPCLPVRHASGPDMSTACL